MPKVQRPKHWAVGVVLCWFSFALPAIGHAAAGSEAFAAASRAFETGDYARALELFEEARGAGTEGAAVHYNIGVCHYQLRNFSRAEASFRSLAARFPEMRDIAEYNLGLALRAQERTAEARISFARARRSNDQTLATLAGRALATLGDDEKPGPRWLGSADVGLGYDDNIALADDTSLPTGETTSSPFAEVVVFASGAFATRRPLRLDVSGYVVRYPEAGEFDQNAVRLGSAFEWTIGGWRLDAGPHYSYSALDGDGFEQHLGFDMKMTRPLNENTTFEWRFAQDDVQDLDPEFAFVDGSRQWLRIGIEHRVRRGRLRASYDFESNDRAGAGVTAETA
jgi:tetratricopeptide (TPR) repeat protein